MFYATKEGHARKVAERVGAALEARTLEVAVHNLGDANANADAVLARSDAAVLVGSVHLGKLHSSPSPPALHQRRLVAEPSK